MDHPYLVHHCHHNIDGSRSCHGVVVQATSISKVSFISFFSFLNLIIFPKRNFVVAAAMFMNSNALPIALMQSLVLSVPDLMWGEDDNKNTMLGRALTYLTMYSTLGMVVRVTLVFIIYVSLKKRLAMVSYSFGIVMESNSSLAPILSSVHQKTKRREVLKNVHLYSKTIPS